MGRPSGYPKFQPIQLGQREFDLFLAYFYEGPVALVVSTNYFFRCLQKVILRAFDTLCICETSKKSSNHMVRRIMCSMSI